MSFSIGILAIGSLYWDASEIRNQWRESRLQVAEGCGVFVPIRYGRCSIGRGKTYTMVFSPTLKKESAEFGTAFVLPCKTSCESPRQLVEEAEYLWAAECNSNSKSDLISARWGSVALLLNPAFQDAPGLGKAWAERIKNESNYGNLRRAPGEDIIVNESGVLNIPWPKRTDGTALETDVLLATATDPTIVNGVYPSPKLISEAWLSEDGKSHAYYFWKNREHGIRTFQDEEIEWFLMAINKS